MIELCSIPDDVRITVLRFIGARGWHLTDALDLASLVMGERERCAVVAKEATLYSGCPYEPIADEIADAVRGRFRGPDPVPADGAPDLDDLKPF